MTRLAKHLPLDPEAFRAALGKWFRAHGRDLPWRRTRDPYAVLVSECMLQQTQVAAVIPFYNRWLRRFPNFAALARARENEVLHAWAGLGYYARARNLHAAAKCVVREWGGQLPADAAQIATLPGIGRYTAGAVATFAFDQSTPLVEANIARVLARLTNSKTPIDSTIGREELWRAAAALLPQRNARDHNSALMDLGATICIPRQPKCPVCPVRKFCRAERPELLPIKKQKPALVRVTEAHSFSAERGRVLMEQSRERWNGLWILPRLLDPPDEPALLEAEFPFTHHRITLAVFAQRAPRKLPGDQRWFSPAAVKKLPLPSPHRRALTKLLAQNLCSSFSDA